MFISIILISLFWVLATDFFGNPSHISVLSLLIGMLCLYKKTPPIVIERDKLYLINIVLFVFLIFFLPYPFNISMIVLIIGYLLQLTKYKNTPKTKILARNISSLFIFTGTLLLAQTAATPFLIHFLDNNHDAPLINSTINGMLNFVNLNSFTNNDVIFGKILNYSHKGITNHVLTLEKLNAPFLIFLFIGFHFIYLIRLKHIKYSSFVVKLISISVLFALFRYILLHIYATSIDDITVFYNPEITLISNLPFVIILEFVFRDKHSKDLFAAEADILLRNSNNLKMYIIGIITIVMCSFLFFDFDLYENKTGKVFIDESHSRWESTTNKFDTTWYNLESGYNYNSLKTILSKYYDVQINNSTITTELLSNVDILIIKTPTNAFSETELTSIKNFVSNGGGLFLIGDHTNVFGMGTYLNSIANMFNAQFNYDALYQLGSGSLINYSPAKSLRNPINHNINRFLFLTGCSICAPFFSDHFILSTNSFSAEADYSQKNFFPYMPLNKTYTRFGTFISCAGIKHNKGRILLFTDSTIWSNFCVFFNGKIELLMNSMNWLNKKNVIPNQRYFAFFILIICIFYLVYTLRKNKRWLPETLNFTTGMLLGFVVMLIFNKINSGDNRKLEFNSNCDKVYFDVSHTVISPLPEFQDAYYKLADQNYKSSSFQTSFVWTQRIEKIPVSLTSVDDYINIKDSSSTICVINPRENVGDGYVDFLNKFVKNGGTFILLDNGYDFSTSKSNYLLRGFGIYLECVRENNGKLINKDTISILNHPIFVDSIIQIQGTDSVWLKTFNESVVLGSKKISNGKVIICSFSNLFSDKFMGSISTVPNELQQYLYRLWFKMLLHNI